MQDALLIGELAERAGIAPSAIRYYESIGLLPEPYRVSGQRRYGEETLKRLEFIVAAQQAGFTLREITELSDGFDVRGLAQRKLPEVKAELKLARERKRWLDAASECECGSPEECTLFDGDAALRVVHVDGCRRARGDASGHEAGEAINGDVSAGHDDAHAPALDVDQA